jgi:hypothetical protein
MPTTDTTAVTVSREQLIEIAAVLNATETVFGALAGNVCPTPVTPTIHAALEMVENLLEIVWTDDAHESNVDWLSYQADGEALAAVILDEIVADPEELLVNWVASRQSLARFADVQRKLCANTRSQIETRRGSEIDG